MKGLYFKSQPVNSMPFCCLHIGIFHASGLAAKPRTVSVQREGPTWLYTGGAAMHVRLQHANDLEGSRGVCSQLQMCAGQDAWQASRCSIRRATAVCQYRLPGRHRLTCKPEVTQPIVQPPLPIVCAAASPCGTRLTDTCTVVMETSRFILLKLCAE